MSELNLHRQTPSPSLQSYEGYRMDHGQSTLLTQQVLFTCASSCLCANQSEPADVKSASVGTWAFSFWVLCGCRTWLIQMKHRLLCRLMCWVKAMGGLFFIIETLIDCFWMQPDFFFINYYAAFLTLMFICFHCWSGAVIVWGKSARCKISVLPWMQSTKADHLAFVQDLVDIRTWLATLRPTVYRTLQSAATGCWVAPTQDLLSGPFSGRTGTNLQGLKSQSCADSSPLSNSRMFWAWQHTMYILNDDYCLMDGWMDRWIYPPFFLPAFSTLKFYHTKILIHKDSQCYRCY